MPLLVLSPANRSSKRIFGKIAIYLLVTTPTRAENTIKAERVLFNKPLLAITQSAALLPTEKIYSLF